MLKLQFQAEMFSENWEMDNSWKLVFGGQYWAFWCAEEKNLPSDTLLGIKALDFVLGQIMISHS